jgi:dipeptidyl aminopeptidase/acylaminoacyl peptidase
MNHAARLSWPLMLAFALLLAHPAFAQEAPMPPLAVVQNNSVWLYGFSDQPQLITGGAARDYSNLVWSPDGAFLAFIARDENYNPNLMLYDRMTGSLIPVSSDIADGFSVQFTYDSSQLVFVKDDPNSQPGPDYMMDFFTYNLVPGATPVQTGMFKFGVGCGGRSPFSRDWRYTAETEGLGGFHLVLNVTPFGLVHSMDCGGSQTGLLNLQTGEDVLLGQLDRAAVSADRTKVAGITDLTGDRTNEQLVVVDLQTRVSTPLATSDTPDQVAWAATGSSELFYSTRHMTDRTLPFDAGGMQRILSVLGESTPINLWEVSLHRFDVENTTDTELYRTVAYAVGRMIPTPDGKDLIFSQIPNGENWFRALAKGTLDMSTPDWEVQSLNLVQVQLFRLPVAGGEAQLIGTDLNQAALNIAG